MTLADWACLGGIGVAAASLVLSTERLLVGDGRESSRLYQFCLGAILLGSGVVLGLSAELPSLAGIAGGSLALSTGIYLLVRVFAIRRRADGRSSISQPDQLSARHTMLPSAVAAVLLLGGAILGIGNDTTVVPPPGTVINATTGQVVSHVVSRTTPQFVQIGDGKIFRACDLTVSSPCGYTKPGTPLRVRTGDIIEFSTWLFNPNNRPVPYLEMYAETYGSSTGPGDWIRMVVQWRTHFDHHPRLMKASGVQPVEIVYPRAASAPDVTYLPGSTVLLDNHGQTVARLPDGILEGGIALTNVGAPASCSFCEADYARYVNFKARVTEHGVP